MSQAPQYFRSCGDTSDLYWLLCPPVWSFPLTHSWHLSQIHRTEWTKRKWVPRRTEVSPSHKSTNLNAKNWSECLAKYSDCTEMCKWSANRSWHTSKLSFSSRIFSPTTRSSISVSMFISVVIVSIHLSTHQQLWVNTEVNLHPQTPYLHIYSALGTQI